MVLHFDPRRDVPTLPDCRCACSAASTVTDRILRAAVRVLLTGEAPSVRQLEELVDLPPVEARRALDDLAGADAIEIDEGRIVAAAGVTLRGTDHTFSYGDRPVHTWCALDAVGLPLALRSRSEVRTRCRRCAAGLELEVRDGRLLGGDEVLWLPGPLTLGRREFCAGANLFCGLDHLEGWWRLQGRPVGKAVDLEALPQLAGAVFPQQL